MSDIDNELDDLLPTFDQGEMDLGLKRIKTALQEMGNPCENIPAIQIAGTNGKGSITSFIQSVLKAAGIRAGVTTSPHLTSWCERIKADGQTISSKELRQRLISLKPLTQSLHLSPFERLTAVALDHFAAQRMELLVLEVGLGGRLDATTAHSYRPIIAMAAIGLDHCKYLGESLEAITKEKAAVITHGSIVISAPQQPEVTHILEDLADKQNSKLVWVSPLSKDWKLGIAGEVQRENAAVAKSALEALSSLGWKIPEQTIREGFEFAKWPARLQKASWRTLPVIVDGAHNPLAAKRLAIERQRWSKEENGIQWILGIQFQKDGSQILRHLLQPLDSAWIVPVPHHLSWTKSQLSQKSPELESQLFEAEDVEEVLIHLHQEESWPNPPPVITGSLYLIGSLFKNKDLEELE